jgi:uncharacterized protein
MQSEVIATKKWIEQVVIGFNFCPFASKVFVDNSIYYVVVDDMNTDCYKAALISACKHLDKNSCISTAFIIFNKAYPNFNSYITMLSKANRILEKYNYDGVYQLASFHPNYVFQDAIDENDATNYTNRSPYPMLHILREAEISKAIDYFGDTASITTNNKKLINEKGFAYMQRLLDNFRH